MIKASTILLLLVAVGCESGQALRARRLEQERAVLPEIRALRIEVRKLEKENNKLKMDSELLQGRCGDLVKRAEHLARALHTLQEKHEYTRSILDAVSDAPAERDLYKAELDKAQEKIEQLEKSKGPIKK
ncbi:MAG: hypothetical protein HN909_03775 [Phycisphaerales bacterium]|nr:hypothetical protein [Phycisphaerales bacterium]